MSDVNAAIGLAQFLKIQEIIKNRRAVAEHYSVTFKDSPHIQLQHIPDNYFSTYQSFVVLLREDIPRNHVLDELYNLGIETTIGTYSISSQPYWEKIFQRELAVPNSRSAFQQSISLPISASIKRKEIDFVLDNVKKVLEKY
jgi:dTDP-4-amino-4,6-dideoxygalactose transaminase